MSRHALIILTAPLVCAIAVASPVAAECPVDAVKAFKAASQSGFEFKLVSSDAVSCDFENSTLTIAAPEDKGATCVYEIMGGRALSNGWTVKNYKVSGENYSLDKLPAPASDAPAPPDSARLLTVKVDAGSTVDVSVQTMTLVGGACSDALDAFD